MFADYLTTSEVATYLRIKERTIYDLVARKEIPCSRATGKLLFPRHLVDRWVEAHIELQDPALVAPPPIVGGSSDPLLEWALRESGCGLASLVEGSSAGLDRLAHGGASAVGLHLGHDDGGEDDNVAAALERAPIFDVAVVHWAWRQQGLVLPRGNPKSLNLLRDVVRAGARMVGRQKGAGTEVLLKRLLAKAELKMDDLNLLEKPALTQTDVALAILDGDADCGLAVGAVARRFGLDFVPLARERFDLACRRREFMQPPLQTLFAFARTDAFRQQADLLGSYDVGESGKVMYNR
jgi:putative molybdopterin biosynthesis protein